MQKYFIFVVFLSFMACENDEQALNKILSKQQAAIETGKNVEILYSDSARLKVRLTAPLMLNYTEYNHIRQEFPQTITAFFYDTQKDSIQSTLKGKYAVRDDQKKNTVIRDNVVWESVKEGKLETSELIWDERTNIIQTDKFVKITQTGQIIYGYGFRTNQDFTEWKINVPTGTLRVNNIAY